MTRHRTFPSRPTVLAAITAALVLQVGYLGGLVAAGRNPLTQLRTVFVHDQLGYLAMAADLRAGHGDLVEPVTRTGVNHYPPLYYDGVGLLAKITGTSVVTAWNIVGIALQILLVLTLALVLSHVSGRWWMGLLAPAPLLMGTFATWTGESWYSPIGDSHAVLWGPFGDAFSKNAGAGGIMLGLTVALVLFRVWTGDRPARTRWIVTSVGAGVIGVISAWQTYSFLILVYLLVFVTAAWGLRVTSRRGRLVGLSVLFLALVWFAGPTVAGVVGQLPMMVLGLLPAVPGFVCAAVATRGKVLIPAAVCAVFALPQVVWTLSGVLGGDPFLTYRVESSHDLGVPLLQAVLRASPALVPLVGVLLVGLRVRDVAVSTVASAALVCLPFLALNDVWGANTEPYRFWVVGYLIAGVVALACGARLLGRTPHTPALTGGARRAVIAGLVVSAVLWTASVRDVIDFNLAGDARTTWSPSSARERAITGLADRAQQLAPDELITTDDCIDPRTTKVGSSARIAYYYLGMAWPDHRAEIDRIVAARAQGRLDHSDLRAADVGWVLTDSRCDSQLGTRYASSLQLVDSAEFTLAPDEAVIDQTVLARTVPDGRVPDGMGSLRSDAAVGTIQLWRVID